MIYWFELVVYAWLWLCAPENIWNRYALKWCLEHIGILRFFNEITSIASFKNCCVCILYVHLKLFRPFVLWTQTPLVKCNISVLDNMFRTPLHWAAVLGHTHMVNMLLDKNANYSCSDSNGATPLHYAAQNNHTVNEDSDIDLFSGIIVFPSVKMRIWSCIISILCAAYRDRALMTGICHVTLPFQN